MSLMSVSMGVFPMSLTKKSCSITCGDTILSEGSLNSSLPKRVGCEGDSLLQYSSNALTDFSCRPSIRLVSERPGGSAGEG